MGFLSKQIKKLGQRALKFIGTSLNIVGGFAMSQGSKLLGLCGTIYDKAYWLRAYDESFIVQVPVHRLEQDFAIVRWKLKAIEYQKIGPPTLREIYVHAFLDLMRKPSDEQTGIAFKQMMIRHWCLCGEVIIYVEERNRLNEPSKIFLVEPHKLTQTPMDNEQGAYQFMIEREGKTQIVTAYAPDVIYFNNPSAYACHGRGVGRVIALSREVKLDEKSSDWSISIYDNGSHSGAIVYVPDMGVDELKELQEEWDQKYTGIDNVGRTMFVSGGGGEDGEEKPISVEKIGSGHRELDYRESKQDLLKRALILFGIPPQVVGQIDGGSRSDTSGADYIHQSKNVLPLLERFTQEFELRLLSQFRGTKNMCVTFESPVKEDAAFRHKRLMEIAKLGGVFKDELRAEADHDPMPGALGQTVASPLNMTHTDADGNVVLAADHEASAVGEHDDADNAASSVALNSANHALQLIKGLERKLEHHKLDS